MARTDPLARVAPELIELLQQHGISLREVRRMPGLPTELGKDRTDAIRRGLEGLRRAGVTITPSDAFDVVQAARQQRHGRRGGGVDKVVSGLTPRTRFVAPTEPYRPGCSRTLGRK